MKRKQYSVEQIVTALKVRFTPRRHGEADQMTLLRKGVKFAEINCAQFDEARFVEKPCGGRQQESNLPRSV